MPKKSKSTDRTSAKKSRPLTRRQAGSASTSSHIATLGTVAGRPVFAEPQPLPDPTKYKVPHASDAQAFAELDSLIRTSQFKPLPFRTVAGTLEPILRLQDALGTGGPATVQRIQQANCIVFHAAGDTGATRGPKTENEVVDKLLADFNGEASDAVPQFFFNLGDIVYSFGEHKYYYDQFYDAYRNYPAPIFAIAGNHDGIILPPPAGTGNPEDSLSAFLTNFCASDFSHSPDALGISRTTMIQPGVYFTFEAPLVRILGLYSNILENPGVISSTADANGTKKFPNLPDVQLDYLRAALTRVKTEKFAGALILAVHHPPYSFGKHSGSLVMLKEIDAICRETGVWPHAVLSGHAHNYQRFTRTLTQRQIPYIVCGNGGHALSLLSRGQTPLRTPQNVDAFAQPEAKDTVTFESYDDKNFGYLRILVDTKQLRIEYHPASDGTDTKTPDDAATVDLATGTLIHFVPTS